MILTATIRTRPDEHAKNVDGLEMDVITAMADDYDAAYSELESKTPDGARTMSTALVLAADGRRENGRWKRGSVVNPESGINTAGRAGRTL